MFQSAIAVCNSIQCCDLREIESQGYFYTINSFFTSRMFYKNYRDILIQKRKEINFGLLKTKSPYRL